MEEKKEKLEKFVNDGLTNVEIGKYYGVNRYTIYRWLKLYNIKRLENKAHPNLKVKYFKDIDTKEKAYWLGYLSADGYVKKDNRTLVLDLCSKDIVLLHKFCDDIGSNPNKITQRIHKCGSISNRLAIHNVEFVSYLVNLGCNNKKSFTLKFIDFRDEELDLAYLMGYYDGDGITNSSSICGASKEFMEAIKTKYNLDNRIKPIRNLYYFNLGANLKRKMLNNYEFSLTRKRLLYNGDKSYKTTGVGLEKKLKFEVSKKELESLLETKGYSEIGRMFKVSDNAIKKRAIKLGIEIKPKKNKLDR